MIEIGDGLGEKPFESLGPFYTIKNLDLVVHVLHFHFLLTRSKYPSVLCPHVTNLRVERKVM